MRATYRYALTLTLLALVAPAAADAPYWQCATFARGFSGIPIYGDARTWWDQAEGRFARGVKPRRGAVMAFVPSGRMRLGHVATVTGIVSPREITVTHANWSPINGTRGQIERDVRVRDVSVANDWSAVRVWFAPLGELGTTAWPVAGFIYPQRPPPVVPLATPRLRYADLSGLESTRHLAPLGPDVLRLAMLEQSAASAPR